MAAWGTKLIMTNKTIHLCSILPVDVKEAFDLFTKPYHLRSWLTADCNIEPKVGGLYELFWEPQDPENNSTIGCHITALTENELIAFEWKSPKQFKEFANNADPLTHVTICFIPSGEYTLVHLIHSGWRNGDKWIEAREWQKTAWISALNLLSRYV